jgi:hypothetical protein
MAASSVGASRHVMSEVNNALGISRLPGREFHTTAAASSCSTIKVKFNESRRKRQYALAECVVKDASVLEMVWDGG